LSPAMPSSSVLLNISTPVTTVLWVSRIPTISMSLPTAMWPRYGVKGAAVHLKGRGDFANHGLIIMDANEVESDPGGGTFSYLARFRSREYSNSAFWPHLEVVLRDELPGDLNCDGLINAFDIDPFVLALSSPEAYELAYPHCNLYNADINGDGLVNAFDIDPFVELLTAE